MNEAVLLIILFPGAGFYIKSYRELKHQGAIE